ARGSSPRPRPGTPPPAGGGAPRAGGPARRPGKPGRPPPPAPGGPPPTPTSDPPASSSQVDQGYRASSWHPPPLRRFRRRCRDSGTPPTPRAVRHRSEGERVRKGTWPAFIARPYVCGALGPFTADRIAALRAAGPVTQAVYETPDVVLYGSAPLEPYAPGA